MIAYNRASLPLQYLGVGHSVMSLGLSEADSLQRFDTSDSRAVALRLLGRVIPGRTGTNSQNTYWEVMGISPGSNKADGAGAMTTKRGRVRAHDYFRVSRGVS